jgi:uncharacterized membrane protein YeaQ/YmgE (transglycosylase-associated protein family)
MGILGAALAAMFSGFLIGGLARFALPGPDPMPFWLTVLIGLMGSATGTAIASLMFGAKHTFDTSGHGFVTLLLAVGFATGLVAAYRILVQKRPLTGPEAHRFPRRGLGVAKIRQRLAQLGIDPDRIGRAGRNPGLTQLRSQDDVAEQLEKLRELRDAGTLTEEEYEAARERLRRY